MVKKISNFITKREGSSYNNSDMATKRVCISRCYRYYSEVKYNTRTYTVDIM
jgi:hypothetical protein